MARGADDDRWVGNRSGGEGALSTSSTLTTSATTTTTRLTTAAATTNIQRRRRQRDVGGDQRGEVEDENVRTESSNRCLGGIFLAGLIVMWVLQSEVAQCIQTGCDPDSSSSSSKPSDTFNHPFMIAWINHTYQIFLVPFCFVWWRWGGGRSCCDVFVRPRKGTKGDRRDVSFLAFPALWFRGYLALSNRGRTGIRDVEDEEEEQDEGFEEQRTNAEGIIEREGRHGVVGDDGGGRESQATSGSLLRKGITLVFFLTFGDWFWYVGLAFCSVAAGTAIFNSSGAFVYIFSVFLLGEPCHIVSIKTVSLGVSFMGVLLIAFGWPWGGGGGGNNESHHGNQSHSYSGAIQHSSLVPSDSLLRGPALSSADQDYQGAGDLHLHRTASSSTPAARSSSSDKNDGGVVLFGEGCILLAAIMYALFEVLYAKYSPGDHHDEDHDENGAEEEEGEEEREQRRANGGREDEEGEVMVDSRRGDDQLNHVSVPLSYATPKVTSVSTPLLTATANEVERGGGGGGAAAAARGRGRRDRLTRGGEERRRRRGGGERKNSGEKESSVMTKSTSRPTSLDVVMVTGVLGLLNMLLLWPWLLILGLFATFGSGGGGEDAMTVDQGQWNVVELLAEPLVAPTLLQFAQLSLNAVLATVFNFLLLLSVHYTSPFVTALGCQLTIPLAAFVDWLFWGKVVGQSEVVGALLIVSGFALLSLGERGGSHHAH